MKTQPSLRQRGFTLLETVIAIGVLAVLLTGFMVVFAPAADGIRKSINVQQADRMASTLEQELVTARANEPTGFDKAFNWIKDSQTEATAILVYQYRGEMGASSRDDKTPAPVNDLSGKPGEDYVVIPMVRRLSDTKLKDDLKAVEGAVYLVKTTQLVFSGGELKTGDKSKIVDPKGATPGNIANSNDYPEAVIAFAAEFYIMPAKTKEYFDGQTFKKSFASLKNPVFTRNLAVRR